MPNSSPKPLHPTKQRLVDTAVRLIQETGGEIGVEQVLRESGISTGSLYHHFEDFEELIETAYARRFAIFVDVGIDQLTNVAVSSSSKKEMLEGLMGVTRSTQGSGLAWIRFERARTLAMSENNERFRAVLAGEQQRLTDALTDLIREAQERGWYNREFDARAAAVLIQSYTLGQIVDDIVDEKMDPDAWIALIDRLISSVFA
jgi:AcrR family transcriptional regulator